MNKASCFELGFITKAHGLQGEVQIFLDTDIPEYYENMESVFVEINNQLIPFFIEHISLQPGQKAIVKFEDIRSIDDVEKVKGKALYLPTSSLPPLKEGQFYFHDVIGYKIIDKTEGELGAVDTFYTAASQTTMVMMYKEKEVLIPVNDQFINGANHDKKEMYVNLPDGLLALYLESE